MKQIETNSIFNALPTKFNNFVRTQWEEKLRKNLIENLIKNTHENQCRKLLRIVNFVAFNNLGKSSDMKSKSI